MFPEDRVLVAYVPDPADFELIKHERWYRIPVVSCPRGFRSEYIAFYFGKKFGDQRYGIHYYAPNRGHELVHRVDLFPDQPHHNRARERYFKIQLGPVVPRGEPIVSLKWRRVTFFQTTWDLFCSAREISDLSIADSGRELFQERMG